jgi:Emfourin
MRIQVERDGGFAYIPGLRGPKTVDTATLPPAEAAALEAAARQADFSAAAERAAAPARGSADHRTVTVTVEDGGASRSITVSDPIEDDALRSLVDRALAAAKA